MVEEAIFLGDINKRYEVIKKIQWQMHNRKHLNYYCIDEKIDSNICGQVKRKFDILLAVLIDYLSNSGFLRYQVLQICNLRIMCIQLNNPEIRRAQRLFIQNYQNLKLINKYHNQKISFHNTQLFLTIGLYILVGYK
ncbi:unnamed protein product [Paramecium sonneborni]|uniref:Uncharacterized protein n=1 Tax=Paramecium sonneborni TaxID=65129 RepID=A0A8S1QL40_9CILI|nr:unnamed protein product [Paramecium sonneborni]